MLDRTSLRRTRQAAVKMPAQSSPVSPEQKSACHLAPTLDRWPCLLPEGTGRVSVEAAVAQELTPVPEREAESITQGRVRRSLEPDAVPTTTLTAEFRQLTAR